MASVQTDPAGELSSSPRGPTSCSKRKTNHTVTANTEKLPKSMRNYVRSRASPARAHLHKRLLRAQASIDPEVDRDIVAVAVDFMLGATYKGCVRLVLKFAEHLKYTFSLEDKVNQLNKELKEMKKLKSPPSSSVSITLESETSRLLSKPCVVSSVKPEAKRIELENNTDFLLPGVVPNVTKINHDQKLSKSPPLVPVFGLQDKAFSTSDVKGSLPQISPIIKESPCDKKKSADTETQTFCASSRKRVMVERACSPIHSQTDPENSTVQEQLKTAQEMVQKLLNQQLAIVQKEKNCRDTETQTECESTRKPELVEKGCSPYLAQEKATQLQQLLTQSEDENKICLSASSRKPGCKPVESLGPELMCFNRKGSITASVTNDSSKSFPGVKNKRECDKCCCTTCVQVRKGRVQKPRRRLRSGKVEWPRIGSCVFVKGRGKGTVKYFGKLEGAGTKIQVGIYLDKPVGENNGTWCKTRYFDCPSNCGVFVPVEHVQQIVTKNDTR